MMPERSVKNQNLIVFLLVAVHLAVALPLAFYLNIWVDEASTLYATQHGFLTAFQTAAAEQKQAPMYFWIVSVWRSVNDSIFFARLFSIICSVFSIRLFAGLALRFLKPKAALVLTAFFALHPFLFWSSLEIRVYSLVILLTIILLRLFLIAFMDNGSSLPKRRLAFPKVWFLFAAIISLYANYYLGFVIAGLFGTLIVSGKWRKVREYLAMMVIAVLAILPLLLDLRSEFLLKTSGFVDETSLFEGLQTMWNHVLTFLLPTEIFPGAQQTAVSMVRLWVARTALAAVAMSAVIYRKRITRNTVSLGVITSIICLFLLAAYFLVGPLYIVVRHASILFVPLLLFVASLIADLFGKMRWARSRLAAIGFGIVMLASFAYGTFTLYPKMTKRGDWARVGEFIRQNESPGQPIVVFIAFEALPLRYSYSGINQIFPDERFFEFVPEADPSSAESRRREIEFVISEIPPDADRIWLAVGEKCFVTEVCTPLQRYVEANYTIEIEREFYLEKVYLLKKKKQ